MKINFAFLAVALLLTASFGVLLGDESDLQVIAAPPSSAPDDYHHEIYGEHEAGGTGILYLTALPPAELGLRTDVGTLAYPEHNKTFLYSVPAVLVLWPAFLLGLRNASDEVKNNLNKS